MALKEGERDLGGGDPDLDLAEKYLSGESEGAQPETIKIGSLLGKQSNSERNSAARKRIKFF